MKKNKENAGDKFPGLFCYDLFVRQLVDHEIQQVFRTLPLATFPVLNGSMWDAEVFAERLLTHAGGLSHFFYVHR